MKIVLTTAEAHKILSDYFIAKFNEDVIVEITPVSPYVEQIRKAVNAVGDNYSPSNKIPRIKALRQIVSEIPELSGGQIMGLGDAKYAIENWNPFLDYIAQHNQLPKQNTY